MSNDKIKQKVRTEIRNLFNEAYSGVQHSIMTPDKLDYFVKKAINYYERELLYAKKLK